MRRDLPDALAPCDPPNAGSDEGLAFDFNGKRSQREQILAVYRCLQKAVDVFGGVTALAAHVERDLSETRKRVEREEDAKGNLKQAFLDYLGVIGTDWRARQVFLFALCREWGYKQPDQLREPSTEEKYRALVSRLSGSPAGEAILKDAAEASGFDAGAFRR